ncbi:sugar phosphate isomerase/epimerase [Tabrizicola sp. J26]|uniref:sugar phosphate isomerase/epimerase family protein n=1 Tax=Alitabrizicola rongguiensis TaxID=2909234 RepID=UPI001F2BFA53|nr:sugar phosphate isomerase/epimerase [Tabrizicola rongguiensis]MCF1710976.1 sugar phosphate isomerase/epimerase [Tabrizicola rongguiensis]
MKLGILTAPFPELPLQQVADWASGAGFEAIEIACWPSAGGEKRRYAGTSHLPIEDMTPAQASEIVGQLAGKGLTISGLGYYPNPLHADAAHRENVIGHLTKVISAAAMMKVGVVNTFVGGDRTLTVDQNWERAAQIFPPIIAHARENGIRLAFENCPMIFSHDEWPGGHNIAYSPKVWRRIFDSWGEAVGMNFDPSHLVWQMIDPLRFIREFGSRMVHVHAKDLMIDREGLYENGIMSLGMGWQVPRMPGLGDVNWAELFSGLYRAGYDGPVIIEHEDRNFEGTREKVQRGFLLARDVLSPFVK